MDSTHEHAVDDLDTPPDPRASRTRIRDESDGEPNPGATPELFEPFSTLLGAVIMIPNSHWGFQGVTSTDHPGACTHVATKGDAASLVKGTDAEHVQQRPGYFVVDPTPENGLLKPTAFEMVRRRFKMHKLKLYFPDRCMGQLNGATLQALRAELARLQPED